MLQMLLLFILSTAACNFSTAETCYFMIQDPYSLSYPVTLSLFSWWRIYPSYFLMTKYPIFFPVDATPHETFIGGRTGLIT